MFSKKVVDGLSKSSWIRAMFEEGEKLRKIYGADKVFDFSIGNPEFEPPEAVNNSLKKIIMEETPGKHRYMSNAGYTNVREKIAAYLQKEKEVDVSFENVIMTCGAAGGLNVVLKALLNPDEEVIVFTPYFVEYLSYIENHCGKPVIVPTNTSTFEPDTDILEKFINPKTKAIIINSPNNPSGVVYSEETLKKLSAMLERKEKELNISIYVIADEPYAGIVYDGVKVPSLLKIFKNSIIVNSFSKSLALPGERIGYIAINNSIEDANILINALIYCNRTLGFVNAPALFQKAVADSLSEGVSSDEYKKRRDILYDNITRLGFECIKPQGAFYLFPKSLIEDDIKFCQEALKYNLLMVPGTGFGYPGHVRISYCVNLKVIENSIPAFEALAKEFIN